MSIGRGFILWATRANLPRTGRIAKIARLRYVGKDWFPSEKSGRRWMFLNPFLARHRTGPKENGILSQKLKKGGSRSLGKRCCGKRALGFDEGSPVRIVFSACCEGSRQRDIGESAQGVARNPPS